MKGGFGEFGVIFSVSASQYIIYCTLLTSFISSFCTFTQVVFSLLHLGGKCVGLLNGRNWQILHGFQKGLQEMGFFQRDIEYTLEKSSPLA